MLATGEGCLLTCTYHDSVQYVSTFHTTWLSTPTSDFMTGSVVASLPRCASESRLSNSCSGRRTYFL